LVTVDDNVRLEVLDWGGSGRHVVLLPGMGNTAHIYDEFAPKLTIGYHVYGITRRGYGASSIPDSGYTADRLGDDVLAVVDSLGLVKPVLVGHSLGGEELSSVGSRHPDRVSGLIYLDAAYRDAYNPSQRPGEEPIPNPADNAPPRPPAPTSGDMASFQALRAWCIRFPGFAPPEAELRQEFQSGPDGRVGPSRTPPHVEKAIFAGMQKYTDIRVPTLAIYALPHDQGPWISDDLTARAEAQAAAAKDLASTGGLADAFERGVPGAHVVRLPHANHYVFMSNEADVLREMRAFLSNLP
jgi:pimeloyl-ACP methyl ester carboxylesterase